MKLRDYFHFNYIGINEFCEKHNIAYNTIRSINLGFDCLLSTALAIEKATDGKVTLYDLAPMRIGRVSTRMSSRTGKTLRKPIQDESEAKKEEKKQNNDILKEVIIPETTP